MQKNALHSALEISPWSSREFCSLSAGSPKPGLVGEKTTVHTSYSAEEMNGETL